MTNTDSIRQTDGAGRHAHATFFSTMLLAFSQLTASACTGFYVGKKVSADGSTLLGRTVDSRPLSDSFATVVVPRGKDTCKYVCTPYANRSLRYASCIINEWGLGVTGTVTGHTDGKLLAADPFVADGACEDTTPEYLGARAKTAREAVRLLGEFIARHGNAEANVYMFADPAEAWCVETYTGHHWAAVRMPEDKVAAFGNEFMIETVDPESDGCRLSPGFLEFPGKAGKCVRRADGKMDVALTFGIPLNDCSNLRTWDGHRHFAPATAGAYATDRRFPHFFAPERKLSVGDVVGCMRSRLEGTAWDPDRRRIKDVRVIGTEKQCTEHVISVRDGVPAHLACMAWVCHANAEHSVFLPVSAAVTETAPAFAAVLGGNGEYRDEIAACAFRRLSAICALDRERFGRGVRDFWQARERNLFAEWPRVFDEAVRLDRADPAAAARLLTDHAVRAQESALADARHIFDSLVWYAAEASESIDVDVRDDGTQVLRRRPEPFRARPAPSELQKAIDAAAAKGGGRVVVPAGRHVTGQLDLRSNVELHLEKGAVLEGAVGMENYRLTELPYSEGVWSAVVSAIGVTNVAITGEGEIYGNGTAWPQPGGYAGNQEGLRPRGVFFADSKDIRLEDFRFRDGACWGIVLKCCDGVTIRNLTIDTHANANNDGIDVEAKNVTIVGCDIDSSDDSIVLKSNDPNFTVENVFVSNCTVRSACCALKLGTASHGTMRDIRFVDCRAESPRRDFPDLRPGKTGYGWFTHPRRRMCRLGKDWQVRAATGCLCVECVDGGTIENVLFRDIVANGSCAPIFVRGGTRSGRDCGTPPSDRHILRNIAFENVTGESLSWVASSVTGVEGCRVENVRLKDVSLVCKGAGEKWAKWKDKPVPEVAGEYPDAHMFGHILPAYGLYARHVDGLQMENCTFRLKDGTRDVRPAVVKDDVRSLADERQGDLK